MKNTEQSDKGKQAEDLVNRFASTAYQSYYCFPNPRDETGNKNEICDLLILFDDSCIIISIKNYYLNRNYERFKRRVIDSSTNQLYGAERKLFHSHKEVSINHKNRGLVKFDPSAYKNIYRITINMGELYEKSALGDIKKGKGFINIIHRDSFSHIIQELDTIPDLVEYLIQREELLMAQAPVNIEGMELDLLATYMLNKRSFPSEFFEKGQVLNLELRGEWKAYNEENQHVNDRRDADLKSYIIDRLVENHIIKETWGEELATELMKLARTERRILANNLYELVDKYKADNKVLARRHFEWGGILYLLISYPVGMEIKQVSKIMEDAGRIYMYKLEYKYEKIVILSVPYDLSEWTYGIIIKTGEDNEEAKQYLEELRTKFGWFQNMTTAPVEFKEFPNEPD